MPLDTVEGVFLSLDGRDEWAALLILISGEDVVEIDELGEVVEVLRGDAVDVVVVGDLLLGDDLLQVSRHGLEQSALFNSISQLQSKSQILAVKRTVKDGSVVGGQAEKLLELLAHTHTQTIV